MVSREDRTLVRVLAVVDWPYIGGGLAPPPRSSASALPSTMSSPSVFRRFEVAYCMSLRLTNDWPKKST